MPAITREAVAKADDLPRERVEVPEWGEGAYVFVRQLSSNEKDSWESYALEMREKYKTENIFPGFRAAFLVRCTVDDKGERIFFDADVELLGAKSSEVTDRMLAAASKLNKLTQQDIDDLKKN